jgi:NodT family efflux transporter outer membrane factor (OMF) lipoprotein
MRKSLQKPDQGIGQRISRPGLIAAAAFVAACAPVGPDFVKPEMPANPAWLDAELDMFDTAPAELAEWWHVLEDPILDELIETARKENNSLKLAGLRVLESQARLNIAIGNRFPQQQVLTGDLTAVQSSENAANSVATETSLTQANIGAVISWEADFWGRFRRGIEAADADLLASIANYDDVMVLVIAAVAETYALVRATEEQLRLAQESYEIQQRSFEITQALFRNGSSSELDALQARTQLLGTAAVIPSLEASLQQLHNALSALLGRTPGEVDDILRGEGSLPDIPDEVLVGIPADTLRQRPDVRRAELQALAQNALVGIAQADLYPSFSLTGSLGLSATDGSTSGDGGVEQLFDSDSLTYTVGANFVWPFLNYGRIRNNVRVQDARLQQALVAYRETVIQAAREVEDAMAGFVGTREQDRILAEGVQTARRSADLSLLRYQEGFADYQRVLQAQQALFGQQQRYAQNRGEIMRNLVGIYRGLGGGWQTSEVTEFVDEETRRHMRERTNWGEVLDEQPDRR